MSHSDADQQTSGTWLLYAVIFGLLIGTLGSVAVAARTVEQLLLGGRAQEALTLVDERIQASAGDPSPALAQLLALRGSAYRQMGALDQARHALRSAINAAAGAPQLQLRLRSMLAGTTLQAGALDESLALISQVLSDATGADAVDVRAHTLNDAGVLLQALETDAGATQAVVVPGLPASPTAAFEASIELAEARKLWTLAARAHLNAARAALVSDQPPRARKAARAAWLHIQRIESPDIKARQLLAFARVLHAVARRDPGAGGHDVERQHTALTQALALTRAAGDLRHQSFALGYLAELYQGERRSDESRRLLERALALAQDIGARDLTYQWLGALARLRDAAGEPEAALRAYRAAVAILRAQRGDLVAAVPGSDSHFVTVVRPIYLGMVDLLLRRSDTADGEDSRQRMLSEARAIAELLKSAELEDYFRDDCVAQLKAQRKSVDQLLQRAAVIYPIALEGRLEVLLSLPSGLVRHVVKVPAVEVKQTAYDFRQQLERPSRGYRRPGRVLYDWLISGIEGHLDAVDTLVFIPGTALRGVPFAALFDGHSHLVERYAIATAPGLSLLDPGPLERDRTEMLMAGLSVPVQGFDALPNVGRELGQLHTLLGGTVLRNQAFVTGAVTEALDARAYSIVHFASHAQFGATAESSFLLTYDGKLTMDGLERFIKLSQFRKQPIELLTLSACQTAAGNERAALGLAGVAVKAGARSTLASLWLVNDEAAAELMFEFYSNLRQNGTSKAAALRLAQLQLMHTRRFRYPRSWAPFVLIGSWK